MNNWYILHKNKVICSQVKSSDLPYVQAQILLSEISKKMPSNHPLKGKAYYAGGSVRDEFLGQVPKDLDIVVEYPDGGISFAKYLSNLLNLREPVIFPTYGTAKLELKQLTFDGVDYDVDGVELEFVQTRKEQYHEDSRKPETSHGTLMEDVERRGFTVNSLLKKIESGPTMSVEDAENKVLKGEILDLTGRGVEDIQNGIIRTPLDPDIIFSEDPLRVMRAIRFSVKYGWQMTDEVKEGIMKNLHRLPAVSMERIRDELDKIAKYGKMHKAIPLMQEMGLLQKIMPEMYALMGINQDKVHHSEGDAYVHTLAVIEALEKNNPNANISLVWAAIAHDWGKYLTQKIKEDRIHFYGHEDVSAALVEKRMRELKYPNDIIKKTVSLVQNHMRGHQSDQWTPKAYRNFYRDMGENFDDILALLQADEEGSRPETGVKSQKHKTIREKMPSMSVEKIPQKPVLNGNQIIELLKKYNPQFKAGPIIKDIMNLQMEIITENPSILTGNQLVDAENMIKILEQDQRFIQIISNSK